LFVLSLLALIMIIPFYNVVIMSFTDYAEIRKHVIFLYPTRINFQAYELLLTGSPVVFKSFLVSCLVTVVGTAYNLVMSTSAAYALSKRRMPGRNIIF
jgi:ABC-type sugar transport system, permease component